MITGRLLRASLIAIAVTLSAACAGGSGDGVDVDDAFLSVTFAPTDLDPAASSSITSGDFNGDGFTDLLLGAPGADGPEDSRPDAGEAYVLLGPLEGEIDLSSGAPDLLIFGAVDGDNLGAGVAAGDLNGDGVDDIIVGAPNSNALENLRTDMGEAYVVFGQADLPTTVDLLERQQDFTLRPAEGFSHLGRSFAVGDVNADGIDDLVAGAPFAGREPGSPVGSPRTTVGEVYVVYGAADLGGIASVADRDEDVLLSGLRAFDQFGASVAIKDVDGDGTADVIVGAPSFEADGAAADDGGGVFVFHGGTLQQRMTADNAVTRFLGEPSFALGNLVAAADLGAGSAPTVVAAAFLASGSSAGLIGAGRTYFINSSGTDGDLTSCGCATFISGPEAGVFFPASLAATSGGDVLALGSPRSAAGSGTVYILEATPSADLDLSDEEVGLMSLEGSRTDAGFGAALAFADLDGDGVDELLVTEAGAQQSSASFNGVVYGLKLRAD